MQLEGGQLSHMGGVAQRAADIALSLTGNADFAEEMFVAGLLHDVGYAFAGADRHGAAGGEVLSRCDFKYSTSIARHGNGVSLSLAEAILNLADTTTSKTGEQVSMEDRLAEIENRFGPASRQYRLALVTASCALRDIGRMTSSFSEKPRAPYIGNVSEKAERKGEQKWPTNFRFRET